MPKDPAKEEADLWKLKHFRRLHPVPEGQVDSRDESPDIVIYATDRRIGIEITDIYHSSGASGSKVQQAAGERDGLMCLLARELDKRSVPPVAVSYHGDAPRLTSGGRKDLAERLARYIAPRVPEPGEVFSKCANHWPYDPELPPEVFALRVARYRCLTRISCDGSHAVFVPGLNAADVLRCVATKDRKAPAYRSRCDEAWLLMCINTADLATAYSLETFASPSAIATDFDRLFLLSILEPQVHEIPCAPGSAFGTPS